MSEKELKARIYMMIKEYNVLQKFECEKVNNEDYDWEIMD